MEGGRQRQLCPVYVGVLGRLPSITPSMGPSSLSALPFPRPLLLQLDVLVDGFTEDGELYGRTQWDAPDVDPIVFLAPPEEGSGLAALEVGQLRRCRVTGTSIFDLEAVPVE